MWREGRGRAPGTCGEVLQGFLADGRHVVVSLPIDRWALAEVSLRPGRGEVALSGGGTKAATAVVRTLGLLGLGPSDVRGTLTSRLPVARGLGSSTADVVAVVKAVADAAGATLGPAEIARLAASIEPSDGVAHAGLVAIDRDCGTVVRHWPSVPPFSVAMAIPAARLDTSRVDLSARQAAPVDDLLDDLGHAAAEGSAAAIAGVATASARRNLDAVPHPAFSLLDGLAGDLGALGCVAGHTGTAAGLLFAGDEDGERSARAALDALHHRPEAVELGLRLELARSVR